MKTESSPDQLTVLWQKLETVPPRTLKKWLAFHLLAFAVFVIFLFVIRPFEGDTPIYFWLPFAWGLVAAVHFFVVATLTVDETWTEERTLEVKVRSYDLGHMEDIRERHEDFHPSAVNRAELDRLEREKRANPENNLNTRDESR